MSTAGLILSLILVILVVAIVAGPLLRRQRAGADAESVDKRRERLLVYYDRILTNLRDLDEDLATGKIAEADHAREREEWAQRGIQVLKALDALEAEAPRRSRTVDIAAIDREIDDQIEAAVAAYRSR